MQVSNVAVLQVLLEQLLLVVLPCLGIWLIAEDLAEQHTERRIGFIARVKRRLRLRTEDGLNAPNLAATAFAIVVPAGIGVVWATRGDSIQMAALSFAVLISSIAIGREWFEIARRSRELTPLPAQITRYSVDRRLELMWKHHEPKRALNRRAIRLLYQSMLLVFVLSLMHGMFHAH